MTIWDERILEHLLDEKGTSVGELTEKENIRVTNTHVSRRCKKLAEHGLLQSLGNGVYAMNGKGKAYLVGKYDAETESYLNGRP